MASREKTPAPKPSGSSLLAPLAALGIGVVVALAANQLYLFLAPPAPPPSLALPQLAQVIDQKSFNVLPNVLPPHVFNGTTPFVPPGHTIESLRERPFHVYDEAFLSILGPRPSLTRIAESAPNPLFHEAVVWSRGTDEVFFVQNAGSKASGTGLAKSNIVQKISLAEAAKAAAASDGRHIKVTTVAESPRVPNVNGAINYRGQLLFAAEGQGEQVPSALFLMHPKPPYTSTVLVNNFHGRQFNSLNDVAVHPRSRDIYFTDPQYGYLQDFRPRSGLPNLVYRFTESTGAVTAVADGFGQPNGITFSPDGAFAYVTDTGSHHGYYGIHFSEPSTIYRFDVKPDGTFENRKTFAFVDAGAPDGIHCDAQGNVYAGCGDGVSVWSPAGTLLGKIFLGTMAPNFQFAGSGRMVICAETELYYVTLAAKGAVIEDEL